MSKPRLELDEKYIKILESDSELNKRVYRLVNSFADMNSPLLIDDATKAISETVQALIREKYPDL